MLVSDTTHGHRSTPSIRSVGATEVTQFCQTKISLFLFSICTYSEKSQFQVIDEKLRENISTPFNITSNALHLIKVQNIYFMLSKMEDYS